MDAPRPNLWALGIGEVYETVTWQWACVANAPVLEGVIGYGKPAARPAVLLLHENLGPLRRAPLLAVEVILQVKKTACSELPQLGKSALRKAAT